MEKSTTLRDSGPVRTQDRERAARTLSMVYASDGTSPHDDFWISRLLEWGPVLNVHFSPNAGVPSERLNGAARFLLPGIRRLERIRFLGTVVSLLPRIMLTRWARTHTSDQLWFAKDAMKYGPVAAAAPVRPFVLMCWGSDILTAPRGNFIFRGVVEAVLKKADLAIVGSHALGSECVKLGAKPEKVVMIPWYDYKETRRSLIEPNERRKLRDAVGIGEEDVLVVSSRWHSHVYSVDTLINAAPDAIKRFPRMRFVIIGSGPLTANLKRMCADLGLSGRFTFLGKLPRAEVLRYTQAADIYVSTSLSDVSSISLLDSMTLGIPIIATDIPGNREWIRDGNEGLLFQRRDSATLASLLAELAASAPMREKLAVAARSVVMTRTDWDRNSEVLRSRLYALKEKTGSKQARVQAS